VRADSALEVFGDVVVELPRLLPGCVHGPFIGFLAVLSLLGEEFVPFFAALDGFGNLALLVFFNLL
jgi:hypothetical protein